MQAWKQQGVRISRSKWLGALIVLLLTGMAVVLFFHKIPVHAIEAAWDRLSWPVLLWALGCQIVFVELRTLRFSRMAGSLQATAQEVAARPYQWFGPTAAYSMTCSVFPGGVGELLLPLYLKPYGVPGSASLGLAVGGRLFDVGWSVILAFVFSLWLLPQHGWTTVRFSLIVGAIAMLAVILLIRLVNGERMIQRVEQRHLPHWMGKVITATFRAQAVMTRLSWIDMVVLSLITIGMKISSTLFYQVIAHGLGYSVGFFHIGAAMMFFSLFMVFPLQGVAGFGTTEAWWMLALTLVGTPLKESIVLALAFHVLNLLYVSGLGGIYMLARLRPAVGMIHRNAKVK
ncbi:lysylphosphatidylglycerol synthase transmembrane domain-containing protein [Sulfobacillus sp. hq2]|uniref:lysylphosphatidylglycerol synthase transmembrane domain-containing protein n=1 Tax=Sulfobacillus TaxID=28033 RepID=UPI000CD07F54|nr:lysylphosphatidylglycerol synthase transmembrane domain-containing protein [Sulfobacillus sp. hq2]POB11925.1 hypothetical protein CO251_02135 [Sulfobacillus sp. hq2]